VKKAKQNGVTMAAATVAVDPKEKFLQDYRKKVEEHRNFETKLKNGK